MIGKYNIVVSGEISSECSNSFFEHFYFLVLFGSFTIIGRARYNNNSIYLKAKC